MIFAGLSVNGPLTINRSLCPSLAATVPIIAFTFYFMYKMVLFRRMIVKIILALGAACALACLYYGFAIEVKRLNLRRLTVSLRNLPPSWRGRKIAFFSDLHLGPGMPPERLRHRVESIMEEKPDLILFGGDLSERAEKRSAAEKAVWLPILQELKAPLGCYAVSGNHDTESPEAKEFFREMFARTQFRTLHNEALEIDGLLLVGLREIFNEKTDLEAALSSVPHPSDMPQLILFHQPDPVLRMPFSEAAERLFLAGHSHNGQIKPFGLHLYREKEGHKLPYGLRQLEDPRSRIYTSPGVGTVRIHARFAAPAEILLLQLEPGV